MPHDPYSGCYYQDPNGLGGYDEWKTRSPYDGDFEEPEECQHEDYEIDWEGRAECDRCDHTWWPKPEVVKARAEADRRVARLWRRYNSWYMRAWRWATKRRVVTVDDDIPF